MVFDDLADNPEIERVCDGIRKDYNKFGTGKCLIFMDIKENIKFAIIRNLYRMDIEQHLWANLFQLRNYRPY